MERPLTKNIHAGRQPLSLKEYTTTGGYTALQQVLKNNTPQEVQQLVQKSNLKGRGGAGFNTGMKWSREPSKTAYCWRATRTSYLKE
jgi:NADH-quinone oxidoreductase subunit F